MSRFLFVTFNGAGNQPPAIGLAQELSDRGHDVIVAGNESQRGRIETHGFRFVPMERSDDAAREAIGTGSLDRFIKNAVTLCTPQLTEVPELFAREQPDALVVDCMMFAALASAEARRLPAAVLVHTAPGAMCKSDGSFGDQFVPELNAMREGAGLPPVEQVWDTWRCMPVIASSIRQLDPPTDTGPADFHYVGPIFELVPPSGWRPRWRDDDDRPLVLVSFSTSPGDMQGQRSRLERTLAGLASEPCRILATYQAGATDLDVPDNADVVGHLPHPEILPQVSATVTHAGHGTTIASLTYGVPLVCLPQPTSPVDQAPLASQVEALGAGRALDGDHATATDIARAVHEVLADPSYRARARELADHIRGLPGPAGAADLVEGLDDAIATSAQ